MNLSKEIEQDLRHAPKVGDNTHSHIDGLDSWKNKVLQNMIKQFENLRLQAKPLL